MIKDAAIDRAENQLIEAFRLLGIYRTLAEKTPRLYTHHWQITIGMVARSQQHLNNTIADTINGKNRRYRPEPLPLPAKRETKTRELWMDCNGVD